MNDAVRSLLCWADTLRQANLGVVGRATAKKLESGEPVILDMPTRVDGYWASASTTIRVGSKAGDSEEKLEALVDRLLDSGGVSLVRGRQLPECSEWSLTK